jgi:hypothetical protein
MGNHRRRILCARDFREGIQFVIIPFVIHLKYLSYIRCLNIGLCLSTCCLYPCPFLVSEKVAKSSWTRLTEDAVEAQEASADCCCSVSKRKATIPLESIYVYTHR